MRLSTRKVYLNSFFSSPFFQGMSGAMESDIAVGSDFRALNTAKDVHYYGKGAVEKHRRTNFLLMLFRVITFGFSLAAVLVMGTNKHRIQGTQEKVAWYSFDPYR